MMITAIIAAVDHELDPLVRGWKQVNFSHGGKIFHGYEHENLVAVAGGIRSRAAEQTARALVAQYKPQMLISAGVAGALISSLKVGNVITPNVIVDAATGAEYRCDLGGGVLVSAGAIADSHSKPELVEKFHALAVDMEAAAVAGVAGDEQIGFRCVKAISDEADFPMPPLNRFVNAEGGFDTGKFLAWAALRPQVWPRVIKLGRNSKRAAQALCNWLQQHLATDLQPARVVRLNENNVAATKSNIFETQRNGVSGGIGNRVIWKSGDRVI
jgi:adenosylhomocysteine nucleosidase